MKTVATAIIEKNGKFLIAKRKAGGVAGGKWEFPGGKMEKGESMENGLKRELREELGVDAKVGDFFDSHECRYENDIINVFVFMAKCQEKCFNLSEHDETRWVSGLELGKFDFAGNSRPFVEKLSV